MNRSFIERQGMKMIEEMPAGKTSCRATKPQMVLILLILTGLGAFYFYLLHEALLNQIKF